MRIGEGRKMVQERAVNGAGAVEHSIKEAGREMGETVSFGIGTISLR